MDLDATLWVVTVIAVLLLVIYAFHASRTHALLAQQFADQRKAVENQQRSVDIQTEAMQRQTKAMERIAAALEAPKH